MDAVTIFPVPYDESGYRLATLGLAGDSRNCYRRAAMKKYKNPNLEPRKDEPRQNPERVFASQSVWGNGEIVETLDESARAHRVLRRKERSVQAPPRSNR